MKPPRVRQQESGECCRQQEDHAHLRLRGGRRPGFSSSMLLLLLLLAIGDSVPSGTVNGYDNEGGTEPICWDSSTVTWINAQTNSTIDEMFDESNDEIFNNDTNVTMQSACYDGTFLSVIPNIQNGRLYTEQPYSFQFHLQVGGTLANETTWMRMLLCDDVHTGFCTPFVEQGNATTNDAGEANRYGYEPSQTLIAMSSGLHLFTRYVRWNLQESQNGVYNATVDITLQVPKGKGGVYFFIGHAVVFFGNSTTPYQSRTDIADAVPGNVLEFLDAAEVKTITAGFKITLGIVVGLLLVGELYLLYSIIKNRKHPVMTLAQAPFLALLTACGIMVTTCSFLYMPVKDVYCNLRILIHVPLTTMSAILVGRLWRVYSTLSIALGLGTKKRKKPMGRKFVMGFLSALANVHILPWRGKSTENKSNALRTKITDTNLLRVIFLLTLPQIIFQVLGIALFPRRELTIEFTEDSDVGRLVCDRTENWAVFFAALIEALLFLLAVYIAYVTQDLPSIFNEKEAIFAAASFSGVVVFAVTALISISDTDGLSPNVSTGLWIGMTLSVVVCILWFIIVPKIKRVWSGEEIVMSKLLASPSRSRRSEASFAFATPNGSTSLETQAGVRVRTPIVLNIGEPPPRRIEAQMLSLKDLISDFLGNSVEGHRIALSDWELLISAIEELHSDLDCIEFMWSHEDEESHSTRPNVRPRLWSS